MAFVVHCSLFFGISLCSCCTYVYIAHFEIGFVLRKKGALCREISTYAEGLQGDHRVEQENRGAGQRVTG